MKPFSVNLSKFKKIAQDHMSTTLKDPNGHEIRIVHSRLPALQKKQLEGLPLAFAEGGDAQKPGDSGSSDQNPNPVTVNVNTPSQAAQQAQVPVSPQVGQTPPNENMLAPDQTLNAPAAVTLEQKAAREQQAIDAARGAQTANIEKGYINQKAAIAQQDQTNINQLMQQRNETKDALMKGMINPNHYQQETGGVQKVLNAIGLLAGGFKQGLVGGNNPAMDFLNSQIDRDIAAQKENQGTRKSIYDMYHQTYGDSVVATNMAKASLLDIQSHQMQQMAAQLATPQAKAAADAFAADRAIKAHQLLLDSAGRLGTLNIGGQTLGAAESPVPPEAGGQAASSAAPVSVIGEAPDKRPWYQKSPAQAFHDAINPVDSSLKSLAEKNMGQSLAGTNITQEKEVPKSEPAPAKAKKDYYETHILAPDAEKKIKSLQFSGLGDKINLAELKKQYTLADQAEKAANRLDPLFDKLHDAAERGGVGGRLGRSADLVNQTSGVLGDIGQLVSGGLHAVTGTETNRAYQEYQDGLVKYIANALRGTNVSDSTIHEFVRSHSPEYGDSPAHIAEKKEEIRNFILDAPETSVLKQLKLSHRKP